MGDEMSNERPLQDFCSPDDASLLVMLAELPKPVEELESFERWLEQTPAWWQESTETVRDNHDFGLLRAVALRTMKCPIHYWRAGPKGVQSCQCMPFFQGRGSRTVTEEKATKLRELETCAEV